MVTKKVELLFKAGICMVLLTACGTDNDSELAAAGAGSCTFLAFSGDQRQITCTQYSDQSVSVLSSAIANCAGSDENSGDLSDVKANWSQGECSTEGEVGRCTSTDGIGSETIYSGPGYSAASAEAACISFSGTFSSSN